MMIVVVVGDWRSHVLRGVIAALFGVAALAWPGLTLTALVVLFGAFALVEGLFTLSGVASGELRTGGRKWPLVLHGIAGVLTGLVAFFWPSITTLALLYLIAFWALFTGLLELGDAYRFRKVLRNDWMLAVAGVLRVAFGVILVAAPGEGALAVTWLIGWFALLWGAMHLAFAWRLRQLQTRIERVVGPYGAQPA
jgi:uncharacterized membrane protein HdeD (DUF308 family)